jgi:PEP-CTERM motif-containing protein
LRAVVSRLTLIVLHFMSECREDIRYFLRDTNLKKQKWKEGQAVKKLILAFLLIASLSLSGTAYAISVGTFGDIDLWVTDASRVSGTGGDYAGVDAVSALIGDDLTDGAINISTSTSFLLEFSYGITNVAGDDFVVFDSRFSSDGAYITLDSGGIERHVSATEFTDSGLDFVLKNTSYTFSLYGAALDLSDWGYSEGDTIYDLILKGESQSDIMGVGVPTSAPVPEPATMFLLGSGLVGLAGFRRRSRKG